MSINLSKDVSFDFEKHEVAGLTKVAVGLGWDVSAARGPAYDLDAMAVVVGSDGHLLSKGHLCFFNNKQTPDGSVRTLGDNLTGVGSGDDETIQVDLTRVDDRAQKIVFWVNIYDAANRKQSFEQVKNAFVRLYDQDTKKELCRFELKDNFFLETAVEFAELNRVGNSWEFKAIGKGHNKSVTEIAKVYT